MSGDDRLVILLAQLDSAWGLLEARLAGLTDEEYLWEPVAGCWSLRPRGQARSRHPEGRGQWLLDGESPPPHPPPFTTIAWRLCHIASGELLRYDWTFGRHHLETGDILWPPTAAEAVTFATGAHNRWRIALEGVSTAELDEVGRSQMPYGLDPEVRFADLLAWTNLELIHHGAEVACLRDLYRAGLR